MCWRDGSDGCGADRDSTINSPLCSLIEQETGGILIFINYDRSLFVASSPDIHFFGFFDQFITEIRVGNADQCLGSLPSGHPFQVDHTIFCHDMMGVGAGVCYNGAVCQCGADAGLQLPLFIFKGRRQADKAFTAL